MVRQTNDEGLKLIKHYEGLYLAAYLDPVGVLTIGHGHTKGVRKGDLLRDAQQAHSILIDDLREFEEPIESMAAHATGIGIDLSDNEFSALSSFCFNLGMGSLRKSTAWRRIINGDRTGGADALLWWNKGDIDGDGVVEAHEILAGLVARRASERALFLGLPWLPAGEKALADFRKQRGLIK